MKLLLFLLFVLLFSCLETFANEKGNGGDGVVCYKANGEINRVTLFDHHEGTYRHKELILDYGKSETSYIEKVNYVLDRLAIINPSRAMLYRGWFAEFEQNTNRLRGIELIDIPDAGNGRIPKGCKLEQLATQEEPIYSSDKRYTINQDLVDHLSEEGHAGLIIHELVLRESLMYNHINSTRSRFLNLFISSKVMNRITHKDFLFNLYEKAKFWRADAHGIPFSGAGYYECSNAGDCIDEFDDLDFEDIFKFHKNGNIYRVKTETENNYDYLENKDKTKYQVSNVEFKKLKIDMEEFSGEIEFYKNGVPKVLGLSSDSYLGYLNIPLDYNRSLKFFPTRSVSHGLKVFFSSNGDIQFDKSTIRSTFFKIVYKDFTLTLNPWSMSRYEYEELSVLVEFFSKEDFLLTEFAKVGGERIYDANIRIKQNYNYSFTFADTTKEKYIFDINGIVSAEKIDLQIEGQNRIIISKVLTFYKNSRIENFILSEDSKLINVEGQVKLYKKDSVLYISEAGLVIDK